MSAGLALSRHWNVQQPVPEAVADSVLDRPILALDGTVHKLREWEGSLVMLNFWATWCAPCVTEMPIIQSVWREYRGKDLEIIGIALDEIESVAEFRERLSIEYPLMVAVDDPIEMLTRFGDKSGALPHSVMLDRAGDILATHTGPFSQEQLEAFILPHLNR